VNNIGKLANFFETDYPLNKEGVEELLASFNTVQYKKNTLILESGQLSKN